MKVPLAVVLGAATLLAVAGVDRWLPLSRGRLLFVEAMTAPGGYVARLVFPAGHGAHSAASFDVVVVLANLAAYTVFWGVCVLLASAASRRRA